MLTLMMEGFVLALGAALFSALVAGLVLLVERRYGGKGDYHTKVAERLAKIRAETERVEAVKKVRSEWMKRNRRESKKRIRGPHFS
jgi:hypothetical protein